METSEGSAGVSFWARLPIAVKALGGLATAFATIVTALAATNTWPFIDVGSGNGGPDTAFPQQIQVVVEKGNMTDIGGGDLYLRLDEISSFRGWLEGNSTEPPEIAGDLDYNQGLHESNYAFTRVLDHLEIEAANQDLANYSQADLYNLLSPLEDEKKLGFGRVSFAYLSVRVNGQDYQTAPIFEGELLTLPELGAKFECQLSVIDNGSTIAREDEKAVLDCHPTAGSIHMQYSG